MKTCLVILSILSLAPSGLARAADKALDLVVFGGTAPGIVAAVRAAREGLDVALVSHSPQLGGSLPSLGAVESHYLGSRAPLLDEFVAAVKDHYRTNYGENSENYRLCLSNDPANRRLLTAPPPGYDRARFAPILLSVEEKAKLPLPFHHRFLIYHLREMVERDHIFHGHALPNRKRSWNATNLTGGAKAYPEAEAASRDQIAREHLDHALGLMWFLQNDPEMPEDLREMAREWGLAKDEFTGTGNLPAQLYVREARRLVGRAVFTEHSALEAPGLARAPVREDSVAITEFSLDSLACTTERLGDSLCDGQLFQMEVSRPGQVPWGALLPREIDNLVVVTTLSATHVGWGAIRLVPTWMHIAESAAWAVMLAAAEKTAPASLNLDLLQWHLAEARLMLSFFNDLDVSSADPRIPAAQYFGTKGFFASYDARLDEPLTEAVKAAWQDGFEKLKQGSLDPIQLAKAVHAAETKQSPATDRKRGDLLLTHVNLLPKLR